MIIARVHQKGVNVDANGKTEVEVPNHIVAIMIAIIAIVPAAVTAGTEALVKPLAQQSTTALENAKLDLERRKASADLLRSALAVEDVGKRHDLVQFLYTARLVDGNDTVSGASEDKIPHWPPVPKTSP